MKNLSGLDLLRWALAFIFLTHSIHRMYVGGVYLFGEKFLNQIGFSPIGLPLAWTVTIFELIACVLLVSKQYIQIAIFGLIFQILMGIILVHFKDGWFVVGAGRNGFEYSFLIIFSLLAVAFPDGFLKNQNVR